MLGAVVLFTAVAYVFTPLTAAGEEGKPIAFAWNVRYIAPAAAVGLAILPCLPIARRSARARGATLAGLCVLFAATAISLVQWQQGHVKGAIAAGVAVLAGFAAISWLRDRDRWGPRAPRTWVAGLTAVLALGALAGGWWEQRHYLERRYENLSPQLKLADAARWARDLRDAKVAVAGVRGVFNQFPFYGTDLSNRGAVAGHRGSGRRLPADPDLRRVAPRARATAATPTSSPPTTRSTLARSPTRRRACGRARTPAAKTDPARWSGEPCSSSSASRRRPGVTASRT